MTFINELEVIVQSTYSKILAKHQIQNIIGKTLNCDSFLKITQAIKDELIISLNNGLTALETANNIILETANNIIYRLLKENYFKYENHEMAVLIGYVYLKRQGVTINNYTLDGINNNSTLNEIRSVTVSW